MSFASPPPAAPRLQKVLRKPGETLVCVRCSTNPAVTTNPFDSCYHFHPEHELIFIESGEGRRHVGESVEPYSAGDLVLIGSNLPHVYLRRQVRAGESNSIVLQFRPDCFGAEFWERPELQGIQRLLWRANRGLVFSSSLVARVQPVLVELTTATSARRVRLFLEILDTLANASARSLLIQGNGPSASQSDVQRIDRIIDFLEANYGRGITLAEAARVVSLSQSSFSRFFSRATGRRFIEFLNEMRVTHACQCLTQTDQPILEICFECGFTSLSNFNHRFVKMIGMAPRAYREHTRETARRPA